MNFSLDLFFLVKDAQCNSGSSTVLFRTEIVSLEEFAITMITMSLGPEARSTGYDVESKITGWMIPPKMLKAIDKMLMLAVKHTGHMYGVEQIDKGDVSRCLSDLR